MEELLFALGSLFVIGALALARWLRRRSLSRRSLRRMESMGARVGELPPTLHPVFDADRCIGSGSCTRACPLGDDVVGLVLGRGALIDASQCIGHGRCAAECPVHAIRLVFGTSERGVDIPELSSEFETNVAGVYITGELGGMGLIRNAVRQASEGVQHVARGLLRSPPSPAAAPAGTLDLVIVGAGPAGLTAGLAALDAGLSYRILEREPSAGGAVLHYPRRKLVLTEPVNVPRVGRIHSHSMSKEEMVQLWDRIVRDQRLNLSTGCTVTGLRPEPWGFSVLSDQETVPARRVMLCVGRRGSPNKLGVPGEESGKVSYTLRDAAAHAGRAVLVVGGGDSALEAACALAEEPDTRVTLSYRRAGLSRAKPENRERFEAALARGRIEAIWQSEVKAIEAERALLTTPAGERWLSNDDVFVFAGGTLPTALLAGCGVTLQRHFGEELGSDRAPSVDGVFDRIHAQARARGLLDQHQEGHAAVARRAPLLIALGLAVLGALVVNGADYYLADPATRSSLEELATYRPAGLWGQTLGVLALLAMLANISYFLRKELRVLKRWGDIHTWMEVHIFTGSLAVGIALLHSSAQMRNLFALALYLSVGVVLFTGVIGRYIYGFVPRDPRGRPLAHAALVSLSDRLRVEFDHLFPKLEAAVRLQEVLSAPLGQAPPLYAVIWRLAVDHPRRYLALRRALKQADGELRDAEQRRSFRRYGREMFRLRFEMDILSQVKRFLGLWRAGHAVLAAFMLLLISLHVGIAAWVGYRWIF